MKLDAMRVRIATHYLRIMLLCGRLGRRLGTGQEGQSMVEYAIVAALVAVVAMVAVEALGTGIADVFQNIVSKVSGLGNGGGGSGGAP
ncbi:MAG: Flp family type IVb pilin [Dehalococcoidia bacterium]